MQGFKLKISWITSWSLSLLLFILGLIALINSCADYLKQSVKQDIRLQVFVESKAQSADVVDLSRRIGALEGIDSVSITYKDNAALALERDLGEDLLTLLSENPLFHIVEVRLKESASNSNSIKRIQNTISSFKFVNEVVYSEEFVNRLNKNIQYVSYFLTLIGVLLVFISLNLITSTVRLSLIENSEDVKTMYLVGATRRYISKPFLKKALWEGLLAGGLSFIWLFFTRLSLNAVFPFLAPALNLKYFLITGMLLGTLSVCMTLWVTFSSVYRFLSRKTG